MIHYFGMDNSVKSSFSNASSTYESKSQLQQQVHQELLDNLAQFKMLKSPRRILDLGCGTGQGSEKLQNQFETVPVLGIDFAPDMINFAREHHRNPFIQYDCQNILELKLDHLYDLIFSNATLHWCVPQDKAIKLIKQYLNSDSTLAFSAFGPRTFWELGDCISRISAQSTPLISQTFWPEQHWETLLKDNFKTVHIKAHTITKEFDSLIDLLCHIKYTGTRGPVQQRSFWTPGFLKKCQAEFQKSFNSITVSYEVFYCIAKL